jgi:hypothetical protein
VAPDKPGKSKWMNGFWDRPAPSLKKAIEISNATSFRVYVAQLGHSHFAPTMKRLRLANICTLL